MKERTFMEWVAISPIILVFVLICITTIWCTLNTFKKEENND